MTSHPHSFEKKNIHIVLRGKKSLYISKIDYCVVWTMLVRDDFVSLYALQTFLVYGIVRNF